MFCEYPQIFKRKLHEYGRLLQPKLNNESASPGLACYSSDSRWALNFNG